LRALSPRRRRCSCSTSRQCPRRRPPAEALELIDGLRLDAGLTVVAAMHDLTLAGLYAPKLLLLSGGRIVAEGAAAEVLTEPLIEEHYGARVRVLEGAVIPVRR
jgi:iron complex transport system ATP-binding protein